MLPLPSLPTANFHKINSPNQHNFVPISILFLCPNSAMDQEIGTNLPKSHIRRSTFSLQGHSRRDNMEHALQLHKSSPSPPLSCVIENEATLTGNISSYELDLSMLSDAQYCYSLLEAIPLPGPTWSTTAPSVLAEPPPSAHIEASVELEWGENQASSYTWWLGFLESLDDHMTSHKLDQALGGENNNIGMENSKVLSLESSFVDAIDDWLMIPTMEKDLGDMVLP